MNPSEEQIKQQMEQFKNDPEYKKMHKRIAKIIKKDKLKKLMTKQFKK